MKKSVALIFLLLSLTYFLHAQNQYIIISSRNVGWVHEDRWNYSGEIKLDLVNNRIFYRKKFDRKFRELAHISLPSYLNYFRDSISVDSFKVHAASVFHRIEVGFRIQFEFLNENHFPYPRFSESVEFGYPIDRKPYLERVIKYYYELLDIAVGK